MDVTNFITVIILIVSLAVLGFLILYAFYKMGEYTLNSMAALIEKTYITITGKPFTFYIEPTKKRLAPESRKYLKDFFFYTYLTTKEKLVFESRVASFLSERRFLARGGLELTTFKKVQIASTAVMLTFGMRKFMLNSFKTIVVYPKEYYHRFTKQYHKGETSQMGVVVFSWKHFEEGYVDVTDNLNLGIHEFAHALVLQRTLDSHYGDIIFDNYYHRWERHVSDPNVFQSIKNRGYLRDYAHTNQMELFAVAVETFFETPYTFRDEHPILYDLLKKMLNLDPITFYSRTEVELNNNNVVKS